MADCAAPGLLRPGMEPEIVMMVCTAGHVDHGKTRLVKLLTGCETDRLKEERERGLTIELGFAPCVLSDGTGIGIVDVPGHEKFIRTMVAGVSGIELAILVIAADDRVKPQTVEHLRIMEFMGVPQGIVALTKTDLVSPERLGDAVREVREFLAGTFLENAPICPVSSETFEGFPEFHAALSEAVRARTPKERPGVFRMPVEQVFSRKGFGEVVMGIPLTGEIAVGDIVERSPGGETGKVRGIQQFLRNTGRGRWGQCLALNIPDLGRTPPERGQVLGAPGCLTPSGTVFVRLRATPGLVHPLKNAEEIKFHTGTAEENGKLYLLEDPALPAGESALAAVVLTRPVTAAPHDRFIIRRPSPAATVGGGEILALSREAAKPRKRAALEHLTAYESFLAGADPESPEGLDRRVEWFLRERGKTETTMDDLWRGVLLTRETVAGIMTSLESRGAARPLAPGVYIHTDRYREAVEEAKTRLNQTAASGKTLTLSLADLQKSLECPPRLWKAVEGELSREGAVLRRGSTLVLDGAAGGLGEADRAVLERILALFEGTGFRSPRPEEVPDRVNAPERTVRRLLDYLCGRGMLVRLGENVILSRAVFREAQERAVRIMRERGELDSADFKHAIDSSRKYALAILDHLDSLRVTIRSGNIRRLAPDYERRMLP